MTSDNGKTYKTETGPNAGPLKIYVSEVEYYGRGRNATAAEPWGYVRSCGHGEFASRKPKVGARTTCDHDHYVMLDGSISTYDDVRWGHVDLDLIDWGNPNNAVNDRGAIERGIARNRAEHEASLKAEADKRAIEAAAINEANARGRIKVDRTVMWDGCRLTCCSPLPMGNARCDRPADVYVNSSPDRAWCNEHEDEAKAYHDENYGKAWLITRIARREMAAARAAGIEERARFYQTFAGMERDLAYKQARADYANWPNEADRAAAQ